MLNNIYLLVTVRNALKGSYKKCKLKVAIVQNNLVIERRTDRVMS